MAKKRVLRKKKSASRKKATAGKKVKSAVARRSASSRSRGIKAKGKSKKTRRTPKPVRRKRPTPASKIVLSPEPSRAAAAYGVTSPVSRRRDSEAAGQSGDIQGISTAEGADSESVAELIEEGQDYEAGVVSGVENAPDADQGEVRVRVRKNAVPFEDLDNDE